MAAQRIGVVGAGILGLAIARRLHELEPEAQITVFEKEDAVAKHQTGHNSGVVHAGLYYKPGSLKATLCRRGMVLIKEFCERHDLPYEECGKLVVARDEAEVKRLRDIEQRAIANEVPGLRWLEGSQLQEIEPNVAGIAALHSPKTAIVDYVAISRKLADELVGWGGTLQLDAEVTAIDRAGDEVRVTAGGAQHTFDKLVLCPGLQADRVARMAGDDADPAIVPFRGEYQRMTPESAKLVRGLIYPVPDPAYPFLGVHYTPRVDGTVDVGPNAVLAFKREGYKLRNFSLRDLVATLRTKGFRRLARANLRMGIREMRGSLFPGSQLKEMQSFVPAVTKKDFMPAPAGVRAQALDDDGSLVDDFRISDLGPVVAVRNAPSPAATSSLAIAEHVVDIVLGRKA